MFHNTFFKTYSSPNIISVPLHFFSSNQPQKPSPAAAVKIQRLFRAFLVRKSVNKISAIRNEVCEVERSVNDAEIVDLIRFDVKERLRLSETLMSLLLQLDSIRSVDFGVRDLRKAVIKKAIAVQEKVDSIVQVADDVVDGVIDATVDANCNTVEVVDDKNRSGKIAAAQVVDSVIDGTNDETVDVNCGSVEVVDDKNRSGKIAAAQAVDSVINETVDVNCDSVEVVDDKKRNIELLEKLMDDNEKMMTIMTQVFERNEMQTRTINSLSRRVERLEKVFVCDNGSVKKRKRMRSV